METLNIKSLKPLNGIVRCNTPEGQILEIYRSCECCLTINQKSPQQEKEFSQRSVSWIDLIEELKLNYELTFEDIPEELYYYFPCVRKIINK